MEPSERQAELIKGNGFQQFRAVFPKIKSRFEARRHLDGLICKEGFYNDSCVLKLQKACWTNDRMDQVQNETGIFFSIWIDQESASKSRANYNIHALKLRQLKTYSITSRDFASDFRKSFARWRNAWPNVSLDYGPLTLMQGWIDVAADSVEEDLLVLMELFLDVTPLIDSLLNDRSLEARFQVTGETSDVAKKRSRQPRRPAASR